MLRRQFLTLLGGTAVQLPCLAWGQQVDRIRRIGVLWVVPDGDSEVKTWAAAFQEGLGQRHWTEGRNLRTESRFAGARGNLIPALAKELVALRPEVILAQSSAVAMGL